MLTNPPQRGEIWLVTLDPTVGHEQAGRRPCVIVSVDLFNSGPAGLVVVVPMTSHQRAIQLHVSVTPPTGGVRVPTDILCEDIRSISTERLIRLLGRLPAPVMTAVRDRLRILLDL